MDFESLPAVVAGAVAYGTMQALNAADAGADAWPYALAAGMIGGAATSAVRNRRRRAAGRDVAGVLVDGGTAGGPLPDAETDGRLPIAYVDLATDAEADEAAASALGVWEWTYRNGFIPPRDIWFLVSDPGGDEPYAWKAAATLAEMFDATDSAPQIASDGWVALIAPATESDTAQTHEPESLSGATLADLIAERDVRRMLAVAVTGTGAAGFATSPIVPGVPFQDRLTPAYALGPIAAGGDGAVSVDVAPWLATVSGVALRRRS
jgi:hypothetical protein